MSLLVSLYAAILFFILVPGVLLRLPPKGGKLAVAAVHALVFGLIYHFTHKLVWRAGVSLEGFEALEVSAPGQKEGMKHDDKKKEGMKHDDMKKGGDDEEE
jgi:hypothetical protein